VTSKGSWIWWQDHVIDPPDGVLQVSAYAGAIDSCTGRVSSVQRFWRGRAGVPISAEVVELTGRPYVVYTRSETDPAASPRLAAAALRVAPRCARSAPLRSGSRRLALRPISARLQHSTLDGNAER
jgi:hypothetical protein